MGLFEWGFVPRVARSCKVPHWDDVYIKDTSSYVEDKFILVESSAPMPLLLQPSSSSSSCDCLRSATRHHVGGVPLIVTRRRAAVGRGQNT